MGKSAIESSYFPSLDLAIEITPNASKWRPQQVEFYGREPILGSDSKGAEEYPLFAQLVSSLETTHKNEVERVLKFGRLEVSVITKCGANARIDGNRDRAHLNSLRAG